jgi:CubicO group peptidase (beta-lactamase class C family)
MSSDGPVAAIAAQLEARARSFVREHRLPGVAAGVVHRDALAWSSGVGFADVGAGRAPDTATLYRVASITKTFTGTAIMQLRDEGRLHLDDPAMAHLPELRGAESPFGPIETVTVRRMLSHESGLQGDPPGTDWSGPAYEADPAASLARASEIGARVPPSTQQKYSNLAYQLLGEIVTRVSGIPYAEYLQARILDPLGLSSTGFDPVPDALGSRRAVGYAARGFSDELRESVAAPTTQAEGGLWSCVADMARWLSFQLGAPAAPQVLEAATLAEMHRPRYLADDTFSEAFGIAWYTVRRGDVSWVQHSGGLHGFITNVCFDPKEGVGAIALVNGLGPAHELAMELAALARDAVRADPDPIAAPVPLPAGWDGLLGLYADPDYMSVLRLEWRDGRLTFVDPDTPTWRPVLRATDVADAFVVEPGVRESGEACTFDRRPDGRVRSVMLGPARLRRLDPVE